MTETQIVDRLELLYTVLQYGSFKTATFSIAERILINQERGSLFELRASMSGEFPAEECRRYKVPAKLEQRIQEINDLISRANWAAPEKPIQYNNDRILTQY